MISMVRLARLPRHQRLRKAERLLAAAERLLAADQPLKAELSPAHLAELLAFLARDGEFPAQERQALEDAAHCCGSTPGLRRALTIARHILLSATGRYSADWDFIDGGLLDGTKRRVFPGMRVYLEDIRSPFNVGAMFRAAESFGVEKLWLSPLCADPLHPRARRTAMGCVDILPWERAEAEQVLPGRQTGNEKLKSGPGNAEGGDGEPPPCFDLETGGVDIADFNFPPRGILIVGSEELGVSPAALEHASLGRLSIKTYGAKGSLNASVAFGIALQRWAEILAGGALLRKL
jgi:TrmH family RNA methyltransferase